MLIAKKQDDIEIIDDDIPVNRINKQKPNKEIWNWSDTKLADLQVVRMTNELFDSGINSKNWLIFFVYDRYNPAYDIINQYVYTLMVDTASSLKGQIAFVDVSDDGELIKETFDVE